MLPNGTIWLCSNVPLTNTYDNTIDFNDATEQYNYFYSKVVKTINDTQYIRKGSNLIVSYKLDDIKGVNYLFYKSTNSSKIFYCFVTSKTYNDEDSTILNVELDVMETYQFDYKINPSYVSREHVDRWDNNLEPIYSLTDEGLDYGEDYITEKAYKVDKGELMWFLVTLKKGDPIQRHSTTEGNSEAFVSGLQPYIEVLVPLNFENYKIGASNKYAVKDSQLGEEFMINDFTDFIYRMSNTALGNYVMEITYVPYLPCTYTLDGISLQLDGRVWQTLIQFKDGETTVNMLGVTYKGKGETLVSFPHLWGVARAKKAQWDKVKQDPLNHIYDKRFESKLLCYPYRYNLLTNWRDTPVMFKNEFLPEDVKIKMSKVFGYNAPCRYYIHNYKDEELGRSNSLTESSALDFPILTDAYAEYMLQNKNTLANMKTMIAIDMAQGGMNGAISGSSNGGFIGAVAGASAGTANAALDGAKKLLAENAKQKDIRNLPASYINSYDSSHSVHDDNLYLTFYRYRISEDAQDRIAYYWHMYGYKSGRVKIPDIRSRNRFNYVQTIGANITGNFDQEDITKIQSIFDRGITFWHYSKTNFRPLNYAYGNYETRLL